MLSRSIVNQARTFSSSAARNHFAKFSAIGFVGNIQVREKKDGSPFVTYSLGVEKFVPNSEEKAVEYFGVSVFNEHQVNYFQQYVKPGARLFVEGDLRNRSYIDSEEKKRYQVSFVQKDFEKISGPRKQDGGEEAEVTPEA